MLFPTIRKIFSAGVVVVMVLTALAACTSSQNNGNSTTQTGPLVIGASIASSGDFSADGLPTKQGYELWADTINKQGGLLGRQVKLDLVSDNSTPEGVTTAYQKLINVDHVNLLVGPFADLTGAAAAAIAARSRPPFPMIAGSATAPAVFQQGLTNIFSVSLPAKNYLVSFAEYILSLPANLRPKTAAYATQQDPFLQPQLDSARALLEKGGITTTVNLQYPAETTDYTPYAQKVIASKSDLVILGTFTPDSIAYVKTFKQQHYNPKAIIAASGPDQGSQFTQPIGGTKVAEGIFVPNGGWFPDINTYQNAQFQKDYIAKFGGSAADISSDAVQAYSVMQVLTEAANKIHSLDRTKLMQELRTDSFDTLQGPVKFDSLGENTLAIAFLFQWQNGNLIPVYPQNFAQATPEFPKAQWPS